MFAIWCVQWTSEGFLQYDVFSRIPTEVSITSSAGNARNSTIWSGSVSSPESLVLPLCLHDSPQFWTNSYLTNMPYDFPELYFWWCSPFPQNRHCLLTALNSTSPIPTPAFFFYTSTGSMSPLCLGDRYLSRVILHLATQPGRCCNFFDEISWCQSLNF